MKREMEKGKRITALKKITKKGDKEIMKKEREQKDTHRERKRDKGRQTDMNEEVTKVILRRKSNEQRNERERKNER